nr:B3 domain-containing protein At5g57720-like isoform X1 [Ipomoea batatas]GMD93498.1 B3 domain-containing protein At5g57720-like isoform X1 [Ipomoea batatas]
MRVLLRNREMKVWMVEISKIRGAMFFENGWEKVVKDNCVTDGDLLFFIYKDYDVFDFFVVDPFGFEKIGMEGERARVVEVIRKESGDESLDIFVLEANICKRVNKYVKKEEGSDLDTCISVNKDVKKEEDTDSDGNAREENDDDHHSIVVTQDMDATEEEDNDDDDHHTLPQEKKFGSSGSKKAIPDHYGADLFLSGRYIQPENAYFVTRIRQKRRGDLYVPKEVIRDYNLQLPSTVTLRDAKGKEWKNIVKVWADGRTWLSGGWRALCRRNLIEEEDQCICEFLPRELGNDKDNIVLQVTVIKKDAPLQMKDDGEDI